MIYADVLEKVIKYSGKQKGDIILIDYGCGNGLLGIFARFCGFKKVILADLDEKFIAASKELARHLEIDPGEFVTGDIHSLKTVLKNDLPDAITGTDVIEHIYSLEDFLSGIRQINPAMVSVFTTASNPANPFKVRALKKIQLKDEFSGGDPGDHILFGEVPLEPFIRIREQIIMKHHNGIPEDMITPLAAATRGRNEADIIAAVDQYCEMNIMPLPASGTNTCNPLNGSWTERILPLDTYISLFRSAGFTCRFYAGFYNSYEKGLKGFVKSLLNALTVVFGKKISPYIVIVGAKA